MEMVVKLRAWATVWATTIPQCTLGTIQDDEREKINIVAISDMLTREMTK